MSRLVLFGILSLALLPDLALAQGTPCEANAAWRRVRQTYPIHSQILAKCENKQTGEHVIVLTEPPSHLARSKAEPIVKTLFATPVSSVQRKRHPLGFDGWAEDLVIVVRARTPDQVRALNDDLALLSVFVFGSAYKAEVEDIARLAPPKFWEAPPALEVSADELFAWLLGPNADKLVPLEGGDAAPLKERAARNETGTYQSVAPGLVVALVPARGSGGLNDHVDDLRRFAIDTDTFLGALRLGTRVALVGRERTASLAATPPLRVETLLLLASYRSAQLSQSYERNRAFAGKLLSGAGDLFGWDWAPILLSDVLNDTEFGSLLNFTDDMLKGWSESGRIEYKGFSHEKPKQFPFGGVGAFKTMVAKSLTYNWNTAGVGFVSTKDGVEIFSVRNTGSLPVSYFPEGSQSDEAAKAKLVRAEDTAYKYFSSLRSPMLGRAVQYAAIYQVFQAFDVRARPPHAEAPAAAAIATVEEVLQKEVEATLTALASTATPLTADFLLATTYMQFGMKGQEFENRIPSEYAASVQEKRARTQKMRLELAAKIASLDREMTPSWRREFAKERATGYPMPDALRARVEDLDNYDLSLVRPPEQVRKAVLAVSQRDPEVWIRTPTIVVSRGEARELTGGHNIGGLPTRVEIDATVPKGSVKALGRYDTGRVIRVNPADAPAARDLVRTFDREVGLYEANVPKGIRALEVKLREAPVVPLPVRSMPVALDLGAAPARAVRGAQPNANAILVGYRSGSITGPVRSQIEALAEQSQAQLVVARVDEGFAILNTQANKLTVAPNHTSLLSALDREARLAALGPPPVLAPKIVFKGLAANEPELTVRNLAARAKSAGGAGGKPPFGGDRPLAAFDEGREPGKHFWNGKAAQRRVEVAAAGKKRAIYVEGANAEQVMKSTPQWQAAEVRFPEPDSVMFANAIDVSAASRHVVEVTVPVQIAGGGLKKLFVNAMAKFREALTGARATELNAAVSKTFKEAGSIDVRDAVTRYKTLMMDEFKADDVWINLRQEGADVIVTEAPHDADVTVTEVAEAAAPRG
jgi:hypothetical protein